MDHLRTYSLLRRVVEKSQPTSEKKSDEKTQLAGEVDEVLSKTIGPVSYTRDDSLKQNVLNHFVLSLRRIADLAKSVGARTLFLSTPVNEKDCEPFKSEPTPGLSPEQVATAKRLLDQGRQLLDASKTDSTRLDSAAVILARGAELDPRNAEMQYWAGQAAFARRDYVRAKSYFRHAIDEDICPLRALTPMRDLVRQVAAETDSRWVDFLDSMENKSVRERGHNILGEPDFLDHVHLNAEDYGYLALGIFDEMTRMGVVHPRPGFRDSGLAQVRALVLARLNNQEEGLALHNIAKVLNWAGKHEDAARVSERALAKDSTSLEAIWSSLYLGAAYERKGRSDLAIPQYRRAIRLDTTNPEPRGFLGAALLRVGDTAAAIREFSITLSLQADNPEVHEQLGQLELSRGHLPQAVDHLRVAVAAKPDQAGLRTMLGGALLGLGRLDEAATEFHAALVRKPGTVMAWVGLGHIAEAKGNFPEAIQNYARAAQLDPQQSEARRELARLLQGGMFR